MTILRVTLLLALLGLIGWTVNDLSSFSLGACVVCALALTGSFFMGQTKDRT